MTELLNPSFQEIVHTFYTVSFGFWGLFSLLMDVLISHDALNELGPLYSFKLLADK